MQRTVVSLDAIAGRGAPERLRPAGKPAGGAACASACGTASPSGKQIPADVQAKIAEHPCYSADAHHYFARMHVAVAPACNIQCHYCNRKYDCANESRPGVVSKRLEPEQAVAKVLAVAAEMPQLSVVGIAGPGDALANPRATFETFEGIAAALPDIKLCLSTNGLALPDHVAAIKKLDISHVTVTLNAIDPDIAARIYPWVSFERKRWTGRAAAEILLARQREGIAALVAAGVLVKINSVLIPGINDDHLLEVNAEVRRWGVFLHNIMPLISDPAHGTHFGLTGQRGPAPAELKALQDRLGGDASLMKHCRQCRADAVGLLGEDRNAEFAGDDVAAPPPVVDPVKRQVYRRLVARELADRAAASAEASAHLAAAPDAESLLVAVCTRGSGRVNQHFGHAREFQIYEVDGNGVRLIGHRRAASYCQGGDGDDDALEHTIAALDGVPVVLAAKIGRCPKERLAEAGITVLEDFAGQYIEPAAAAAYRAMTANDQPIARSA
ncbi:MAG: nitrogenase cofactor biosynthesis protein NifB [Rhodospirillales bacterium]|nr:nitrogenase cofactor biosynthesis protein NifB [Rhodospirillales bacterium]